MLTLKRLVLHGCAAWLTVVAIAPQGFALEPWPVLLDSVKANPDMKPFADVIVDSARQSAALPIIKRAHALAEVGSNRTWLDGRSNALEDEIREDFALAMSDFAACNALAEELPLLAAAYRLTDDSIFLERTLQQLREMAAWSPLQRPGWSLYAPGNRLPADGKDGNWLATGCGVRAIADTLAILPVGDLDAELASRLHALLEAEIAAIVDDWQAKRPWFVSSDNAVTNQWVLPTEGLVRACLLVGREGHRDAYELGVRNLLRALDAHGAQGEFEEGFGYAGFTVTSLAHAAFAMAIQGDRRAIDHPFLKHFPTWYIHHLQPGNMVINCFDAGGAYDKAATMRPLLSLLAVCTADPTCLWGLEQVGGPSDDLAGLAARGIPPDAPRTAPPRFAQYERATRVNWRSGWQDNASGVWVRGGHPLDQHDHQDRGHVNFILHGRPVFIEAGTPAYHHPRMMTQYTPGVGHNVLQIGTAMPEGQANAGEDVWLTGWQKRGGIAPITVKRLDEAGGEVILDASACYDGLDRWTRNVDWQEDGIRVTDRVALAAGTDNIILFRWHLGTESPVSISGEGTGWVTDCSCARIHIEADRSIVVTQIAMPDHTLAGHTGEDLPANTHTCLVVQSAGREPALALTTTVE